MLFIKGNGQIFGRNFALARVHHFHIAADGEGGETPFNIAPALGVKRFAHTYGKAQHFNVTQPRHNQMPQLMQANEYNDNNNKCNKHVQSRKNGGQDKAPWLG